MGKKEKRKLRQDFLQAIRDISFPNHLRGKGIITKDEEYLLDQLKLAAKLIAITANSRTIELNL